MSQLLLIVRSPAILRRCINCWRQAA